MKDNLKPICDDERPNDVLVWKYPADDFKIGTQLIVNESQEALLFANGQALDLFGPGRHTLVTENLPIVSKFFNRVTGQASAFHCQIYFISKAEQLAMKWGTDSKIEYIDPKYGFPIRIGACGEMYLSVSDSRKLIVKVVGTEASITQQVLSQKLRAILLTNVKTYIASFIKNQKINIFEIDERLAEMSDSLLSLLQSDFLDYGIAMNRFFVTTIAKPDDDPNYNKFKDIHFRQYSEVAEAEIRQKVGVIDQQTQAQKMVIESEGLSKKREQEGYSYQEEKGFDVAQKVASNPAVGSFANAGMGLGMMLGVGGAVGGAVGPVVKDSFNSIKKDAVKEDNLVTCPSCGARVSKGKFCSECGKSLERRCPQCNSVIPSDVRFCPECGKKIGE